MIRQIIKIDKALCNGCGACAIACHEGAIAMVNGKAKLIRDDYCDGLGDCLPSCPTNAIAFEQREALPYDEQAVQANIQAKQEEPLPCGCPGSHARVLSKTTTPHMQSGIKDTQLNQWPVQIKLVPTNASYFHDANLLIAADCSAFAYGDFHNKFIRNHVTLIGCPKLDDEDYSRKLCEIIQNNDIKSVSIVRMQVPCCGGIEQMAKTAIQNSGKFIPWQVYTISCDGEIID